MKTIINLLNGQSVRTTDNAAADLAGLINSVASGQTSQAIYQCTDIDAQSQHHIVLSQVVSVYEQP